MADIIYNIFEYLTDIPYNVWPWFALIIAPAIVLYIRPSQSIWLRIGRLILAIGCVYIFINLMIQTHHTIEKEQYELCRKQYPNSAFQMPKECGNPFIGNGAQNIFYLFLGWIPSAAYVGFWEWIWRRKHKENIQKLGKSFKGKWFSTVLIVCSVPVWMYAILLLGLVLYMRIDCPPTIVSNGKCWFPN
ncbi:MAG: hypothetical protein U1E36_04985 [Rickettsiales bacterium]